MPDDEVVFDDSVQCPTCGASIPVVKMDVRFIARYQCPQCGEDVVVEGERPQARARRAAAHAQAAKHG